MTRSVTIAIEQPDPRRILAKLREGDVETQVTGWGPAQAAADLVASLDAAAQDGYGECFWVEPAGQYWWLLRREDRRLEVVVLWSDSPGRGWQHVFRATDEVEYVSDMIRLELGQLGLGV